MIPFLNGVNVVFQMSTSDFTTYAQHHSLYTAIPFAREKRGKKRKKLCTFDENNLIWIVTNKIYHSKTKK